MKNIVAVFCLLLTVNLTACGGGSSYSSQVNEVSTRDKTIIPGARTQVRVRFTPGLDFQGFDSDGDEEYVSEPFGISVFLPSGVRFVEKSSRLTDSLTGDVLFGNPDKKEPIEQGMCSDGRFFIRYFFERNEIADADSDTLISFYLKFEADVAADASGREIGAAISYEAEPCAELPDETTILRVEN